MISPAIRLIFVSLLLALAPATVFAQDFTEEETAASVDVRELDTPPKPTRQTQPNTPSALRGMQASVQVGFLIDEKGKVRKPRIIKTSNASFNDAVLNCVREWEFEPGLKNGEPVSVRVIVPMRFK